MKDSTRRALMEALDNAAEMIRSHPGSLPDEDISDVYDFETYTKQCERAFIMISKLADKQRKQLSNQFVN